MRCTNRVAMNISSNKGFTLIEVLIASIILFVSVLTVNAAFKQYAAYKIKQQKYERIYISVLSLKDKTENESLGNLTGSITGKINGLPYTITAKRIASARNYVYSFDQEASGNKGGFIITLYQVTINIAGRSFKFYKTEYKK